MNRNPSWSALQALAMEIRAQADLMLAAAKDEDFDGVDAAVVQIMESFNGALTAHTHGASRGSH